MSKTTRQTSISPDAATAYARAVASGEVVAGPHVRASCARHLLDLEEGSERGLSWDIGAAERALRFFPDVLRLCDQFEGMPFNLHPSQAFIVGSIFGWKRADGRRRFRRAYIEQAKGNGKALALDTPIPTPAGWTTMGELKAGDNVFGSDGLPCQVIQAHPVSTDIGCYEVEFDDGSVIVASAEHLWNTEHRRPKPGGASVKTTSEIAATLRNANGKYRSANHSVALCGPLVLPQAELPVPPYVLGAWLGDGDSDVARLTCAFADIQVVEEIVSEGQPVRQQIKRSETTGRFGLGEGRGRRGGTLQERLRALGVLGNKHIPGAYLRSDIAQRFALLQGLMDTDGSIFASGQCEFTSTNRALAKDVLELVSSLGIKATVRESDAMLNGRRTGARYRVCFAAPWDRPVFRLKRKAARQVSTHNRRRLSADRRIVACRPIAPVPVRCITVDSADSMFLCGRAMIPTHNSPLAGGIGLYGLTADNEHGAQIFAAASKMEQARILFNDAVSMVRQSPALEGRLTPTGGSPVQNLAWQERGSFFRPVGRDTGKTGSGMRPHFVLVDELHEHPNRDTLEMLERGFKSRRNPLVFMITNSGSDRNSVCWEEHEHAVRVAHGEVEDDRTFSYVCALDDDDDPFNDEECWIKANPLLDVVMPREELRDAVKQAKDIPGRENTIRRLHFCQWTDAETAWISRDIWNSCIDSNMTIEEFSGRECWVGLDLGAKRDLTAWAAVFDDGETEDGRRKYALFSHGYTPKDTMLSREEKDGLPYPEWVNSGFITATSPGTMVRLDIVAYDLVQLSESHPIALLAYDTWMFSNFIWELSETGVSLPVIEHPQSHNRRRDSPLWMPSSIDHFEELIMDGRLRVSDNKALSTAVSSARLIKSPVGLRKFDKQHDRARIDMAVASAMAVGAAMLHETGNESYIESDGLMVL